MQHINQAIKDLIKREHLQEGFNEQKAMKLWNNVVGELVANNTKPISISRGVLNIETKTPVWRQELQIQKGNIITKINKNFKTKVIKDIRFI